MSGAVVVEEMYSGSLHVMHSSAQMAVFLTFAIVGATWAWAETLHARTHRGAKRDAEAEMSELPVAASAGFAGDKDKESLLHAAAPAGPRDGAPVAATDGPVLDGRLAATPGTPGEIIARGPNVMQGYWNRPEETAKALRGGWMHTGDGGYFDDEGYFYVVDRVKDMIISGGENIYSVEVENAISQHPAVQSCAVIGIPHEEWVETVHAIIVPYEGKTVSQDEIIEHCRERIARYKCPRSVEVRSEPLPLSAAGKILKRELRKEYLEKTGAA